MLSSAPGFEVAGEVGTGEEAIARARAIQPDVVLMDLRMPGLDGIEATRRISRDSPHVAVLALTMLADDDSVFAAMRAGARGYLLKGALKAEILRTIQGGGQRRGDLRTRHRAAPDAVFATARPPGLAQTFPELTEREDEILTLIAQGRTNAEIAERLCLSRKDGAQPRLQDFQQAAGGRSCPGGRARPRGRARLRNDLRLTELLWPRARLPA